MLHQHGNLLLGFAKLAGKILLGNLYLCHRLDLGLGQKAFQQSPKP